MAQEASPPLHSGPFSLSSAIFRITSDASERCRRIASRLEYCVGGAISLLPRVRANGIGDPYASGFNTSLPETQQTSEDVESITELLDFQAWVHRGSLIRHGNNRVQCAGNLSIALGQVGPLYAAEISGASGVLSLLPTAGVLIGAPAKELWVLYQLMPLAGVLSMLLSLGGNIIPTSSTEYEVKPNSFAYGGMVATTELVEKGNVYDNGEDPAGSAAESFANKVEQRAQEQRGSTKRLTITFGICLQLFWFGVLLVACWLTQSGGIITWWCQAWAWMYFWVFFVAVSSLIENYAGVPFSKQWTIRVSRAPRVRISDDAPLIARAMSNAVMEKEPMLQETLASVSRDIPRKPVPSSYSEGSTNSDKNNATYVSATPLARGENPSTEFGGFVPPASTPTDLLLNLDTGYNTKSRVIMDPNEPWSQPRVPFYVIISLQGITPQRAILRVIAKFISVGAFTAGTSMFASATLITITVASIVLCLVLGAGIFGRVIAMWMIAEIMKTDPVMHRVVRSRADAAEYIRAILSKPGLTCEVMGHVIVEGRCVKRYNEWFSRSAIFGVLAAPFDITSLAVAGNRR